LAVAQSEFRRFVHLARKALNIKLGLSNAMLSLFSHMGDFTRRLLEKINILLASSKDVVPRFNFTS
jgi:hypothetical protein